MDQKLKKRYGLPTAISMVVGIVIGSGIFFKTEAVLKTTGGNAFIGILALGVMCLVMIFGSLAFSILAQRYEKVSGLVDYAEATCGEKYAYYVGFFMTFVFTPSITGVLCYVTSIYFCNLFGFAMTSGECLILAGLFLIGDTFINAFSPKLGGKIQVSGTIIKMIPLTLMAVVGIIRGTASGQIVQNFAGSFNVSSDNFVSFLSSAIISLAFAFEGWICAANINAELKDAKKTLPKALVLGAIIIALIYIFYYLGICGSITIEELMATSSMTAFTNVFGNFIGSIIMVFVFISTACSAHGMVLANCRCIYSLAVRDQGPRPDIFKQVDPILNMPMNSVMLATLTSMVWMVFYYGANISSGWFGFFNADPSDLSVPLLYLFYIPILFKLYSFKELGFFKSRILPTIALINCVLLNVCAIIAHGPSFDNGFEFSYLSFMILSIVTLLIGSRYYHPAKK